MITYQHENYIRDAVGGVLMQEGDFDIELIIGDDCSSDDTGNIIKDIINNHPKGHIIKYHRHKKNIGLTPNFAWALHKCKGNFIAICDGDDYWTDPYKLQKQLDFLEANSTVVLTHHLYKDIDSSGTIISEKKTPFTSTLMFRNVISKMPNMRDCPNPDQFLYTFLSLEGDFKYLDHIGHSVRRYHVGGVMSMQSLTVKLQRQVKTWSIIYEVFKDTKLKKQLFEKKNIFIYRDYLLNWDNNKYDFKKIILFPVYVKQFALYKLLIRKLINKEQKLRDFSASTD
jgi:glycosyltransferase involved in cell wall biosynthesis